MNAVHMRRPGYAATASTRTKVLDALEVYRPQLAAADIERLMPWLPRW